MKLKHLFFALTVMVCFTTAQAQVKVGANPGTISSSSNLEVEATDGNKVIVNKSNGTVIIQNTPSGSTTDSLMTIDASGNVHRVNKTNFASTVAPKVPYFAASGTMQKNTAEPSIVSYATNLTPRMSSRVTYNASAGTITIQESGFYYFGLNTEGAILTANVSPKTNDHCAGVYKNGVLIFRTCGRSTASYNSTTNSYNIAYSASATTSGIQNFSAGDVLTMGISTASDLPSTGTYKVDFNLYMLSN